MFEDELKGERRTRRVAHGNACTIAFIITVGLVFHVAYLPSIVDLYFRSPLVHDIAAVSSIDGVGQVHPKAAADRLVLFVGV